MGVKLVGFVLILSGTISSVVFADEDPTGTALNADVHPGDRRIANTELVLGPIKKGSVFHKIGLQEGDFIKEWNGRKIVGRQDWKFIEANISVTNKFRVVIERDGNEMVLQAKILPGQD